MRAAFLLVCLVASAVGCAPVVEVVPNPPDALLPAPPPVTNTEVGQLPRPFWQPEYQKEFFAASHVAPTEASRKAAARHLLDFARFKRSGDHRPWELLLRCCLPDGRFEASGTYREQAITFSVPWSPSTTELATAIYAAPSFRGADGARVPNSRREVLYVLPGENRVRRVHPDEIRYARSGKTVIYAYPGGKVEGPTFRTAEEARGEAAPPPPPPPSQSRFIPLMPGE